MFRNICLNERINSIIRASRYHELFAHTGETVDSYQKYHKLY